MPNKPSVFETRCFYGQLHKILVCIVPESDLFEDEPVRRIFAEVERCETDGLDATLGPVTYTRMHRTTAIIELVAISCVVGRVKVGRGRRWGIIDRSKGLVRPAFIEGLGIVEEDVNIE